MGLQLSVVFNHFQSKFYNRKFIFSFHSFLKTSYKFQISNPEFSFVKYMKNSELNREFNKLVNGRMKKLSRINLKQELDFRENISELTNVDGHEVFGE